MSPADMMIFKMSFSQSPNELMLKAPQIVNQSSPGSTSENDCLSLSDNDAPPNATSSSRNSPRLNFRPTFQESPLQDLLEGEALANCSPGYKKSNTPSLRNDPIDLYDVPEVFFDFEFSMPGILEAPGRNERAKFFRSQPAAHKYRKLAPDSRLDRRGISPKTFKREADSPEFVQLDCTSLARSSPLPVKKTKGKGGFFADISPK